MYELQEISASIKEAEIGVALVVACVLPNALSIQDSPASLYFGREEMRLNNRYHQVLFFVYFQKFLRETKQL